MKKYKILWTDMHSNLHHEQIKKLPKWIEQMKETMDFWPIAYYPFGMVKHESGFAVEDKYADEAINKDWEYVRKLAKKTNEEGFPMFMGYEWQGAGLDGDHNVYFKDCEQNMAYPLRYQELKEHFSKVDAIAVPHHLAYQLNHRGKNWETHCDKFSPFVEIYSSHGSSENDTGSIDMVRHIHMGPRTGQTCVERGWQKGYQFGVIASGDNHSCPGVYGFGYCAVLAKSNSKDDIWDALINKRVYGVSKDKIKLDYRIDGAVMGETIKANKKSQLHLEIIASNALDRIEIIKDSDVVEMIPHTSTWEKEELKGKIKFKFKLDLGWGPDRRVFPDIESKHWTGSLHTSGKLISIEKCWSNFGQKLENVTDNSCDFEITSYKTTATGKWMGPSAITTEGFIFEIEDDVDSSVTLVIDDNKYELAIRDMLYSSRIIPLYDEAKKLIKDKYDFEEYYRSDSWWHNSYKIKIGQAVPEIGYRRLIEKEIDTTDCSLIRIRGWQKNGGAVWSTPIFVKKEG